MAVIHKSKLLKNNKAVEFQLNYGKDSFTNAFMVFHFAINWNVLEVTVLGLAFQGAFHIDHPGITVEFSLPYVVFIQFAFYDTRHLEE